MYFLLDSFRFVRSNFTEYKLLGVAELGHHALRLPDEAVGPLVLLPVNLLCHKALARRPAELPPGLPHRSQPHGDDLVLEDALQVGHLHLGGNLSDVASLDTSKTLLS